MSEALWVEKYRPHKIDDCVLPESIKETFRQFVAKEFVPNILLAGSSGVGKTTVARALVEELGCDYIVYNGSLNVDKATLRNDIASYASAVSLTGGRKYIILDEADNLTGQVQLALRNFIEEFSGNCGFILTCNYKNKLIPALHSRLPAIEFKISKDDTPVLSMQFLKLAKDILDKEGVTHDKGCVAGVIAKYFPDWRRVIGELQNYAAKGHIDTGILAQVGDTDIKDLIVALKKKDFPAMRKWVGQNSNIDPVVLYRRIYDTAYEFVQPDSIPPMVLCLADYQYKSAFVVDQEVNTAACMTQLMCDCEFV